MSRIRHDRGPVALEFMSRELSCIGALLTGLVDMAVYDRDRPWTFDIATRILSKGFKKHMMIPCKPLDKSRSRGTICRYPSKVPLERRRDVVGVGKVEVLGHVHLTEQSEKSLFFHEIINLVVESYRNHVRPLKVIDVMPPNQRYSTSLGDEDQVPACGKLDKAYVD